MEQKNKDIRYPIISALDGAESLSINEIALATDTSVPTVTKYVGELCKEGIVENCGKVRIEHGRKPSLYRIGAGGGYFIGAAPGPHCLRLGLMDMSGRIVLNKEMHKELRNTPDALEGICSQIDSLVKESGIERESLTRVSINISGRVNPRTGYSYSMFNFENDDAPLAELLSRRLSVPTLIENDTRAMAFGELRREVRGKWKDFLFINAGWGLGMSIIIGGQLYYGMAGYCGEIGHTNVFENEKMCHCGKKGCLETEASGRALCEQFKERSVAGEVSLLSGREDITEADIINAAIHEDTLCIELIEQAGALLGKQIANYVNIFNPEAVIIGGTLAKAGDCFIQPIKLAVQRYTLRLMSRGMKIIASELGEEAGVLGACLRAREDYLKSHLGAQ